MLCVATETLLDVDADQPRCSAVGQTPAVVDQVENRVDDLAAAVQLRPAALARPAQPGLRDSA